MATTNGAPAWRAGDRPKFCAIDGSPLDAEGRCPHGHVNNGGAAAARTEAASVADTAQRAVGTAAAALQRRPQAATAVAAGVLAALLVIGGAHIRGVSTFLAFAVFSALGLAIAQRLHRGGGEPWKLMAVDGVVGAVYYTIWSAWPAGFHVLEPIMALVSTYLLSRPALWELVGRRLIKPRRSPEGLQQALADLDGLIGLAQLKSEMHSLVREIRVEQEHGARTGRPYRPTLHVVFTGPPGTGKTSVARLLGRLYFELGLLDDGHLVEVGREDLVGQYVGQTAPRVAGAVARARGGVLFFDEAYTLLTGRGANGADFGKAALDALLRHMENDRGAFCCILAGYEQEVRDLLRVNPGLQSRVPHVLHFADYSPDDLAAITCALARGEGLTVAEDAVPVLVDHYTRFGRGEDGNGRLARNIVEAARRERSRRLAASGVDGADLAVISRNDVLAVLQGGRSEQELERALAELDALVGLRQVKADVHGLVALMREQGRVAAAGGRTQRPTLHMAFLGPPGTGKTTVARLMGRILFHMGLLERPAVAELNGATLAGEHQGETGARVEEAVARARGGVLFLDEAYALLANGEFGEQALNALLVPLENERDRFCCILAGYPDQMERLFDKNPGFRRRVPNIIHFTDYTADELVEITRGHARSAGYALTAGVTAALQVHYGRHGRGDEGNGGLARRVFEQALRAQAVRLASGADSDRRTLTEDDVAAALRTRARGGEGRSPEGLAQALGELDALVGLAEVKREIHGLVDLMRFEEERARQGGRAADAPTLHVAFLGPPGTGKTTVARLLGRIYFQLGLVADGHLSEVARGTLVGMYEGHTAPRVEEAVRRAHGGVLFIDEAYELDDGRFGREAIDTLIKLLEDDRDRFCCVVAGYEEPMRRFFAVNSGFVSRVPTMIHFRDYTPDELLEITRQVAAGADFSVAPEAEAGLLQFYARHGRGVEGNGRLARNVFEAARLAKAARFAAERAGAADLGVLSSADIEQALERMRAQLAAGGEGAK